MNDVTEFVEVCRSGSGVEGIRLESNGARKEASLGGRWTSIYMCSTVRLILRLSIYLRGSDPMNFLVDVPS